MAGRMDLMYTGMDLNGFTLLCLDLDYTNMSRPASWGLRRLLGGGKRHQFLVYDLIVGYFGFYFFFFSFSFCHVILSSAPRYVSRVSWWCTLTYPE